ncbi:40S ribosomal protein S5-1 [Hordeum vulgare]|nr:40S ribosomal protein S5-1 [Hordeum vulgare]
MLYIRDVEGPKKTRSVETRLEVMEQQVIKCQGMVERGLNANHMMITEFTSNRKMDAIDIGKHLSRLYDRVDQLQGQIYDLQNQNFIDCAPIDVVSDTEHQDDSGDEEDDEDDDETDGDDNKSKDRDEAKSSPSENVLTNTRSKEREDPRACTSEPRG